MQTFDFPEATFWQFALEFNNCFHAYLSAFSKRFFLAWTTSENPK